MTITVSIQRPDVCPECGGLGILTESSVVCDTCGLVLRERSENCTYELNIEGETRNPQQYVALGQRSYIENGLGTSPKTRDPLQMRLWSLWSHDDLYLYRTLMKLNRVSSQLNIPDQVRDRAAMLFRKFRHNWNNPKALLFACLVRALREHAVPILEQDLKDIWPSTVTTRERNTAFFFLQGKLGTLLPLRPEIYLAKLVWQLQKEPLVQKRMNKKGIDQTYWLMIQSCARMVLNRSHLAGIPMTLAASCIYSLDIKNKHVLTKRAAAKALGISEYTLETWAPKWNGGET